MVNTPVAKIISKRFWTYSNIVQPLSLYTENSRMAVMVLRNGSFLGPYCCNLTIWQMGKIANGQNVNQAKCQVDKLERLVC